MSNRDKFKAANFVTLGSEPKKETITDSIIDNLEQDQKAPEQIVPAELPVKPKKAAKKNAPGRPRKFRADDETVVLGIKVLAEEARFLEKFGGLYGGKTGYVTHLIREEMKRLNQLS